MTPRVFLLLAHLFGFTCGQDDWIILVGNGMVQDGFTTNMEIVDLSIDERNCDSPQDFPIQLQRPVGAFLDNEMPVICGDSNLNGTGECFQYENENWQIHSIPTQPRSFGTILQLIDNSTFLIGGEVDNIPLKSVEKLELRSWVTWLQLSETVTRHCSVELGDSKVLIIGGHVGNDPFSTKSFILDIATKEITQGDSLSTGRQLHSCGRIRKQSSTNIIAVGGRDNLGELRSSEIFDTATLTWRKGPSLPFGVAYAALVQVPSGGVILMGGQTGYNILDTMFSLVDEFESWQVLTRQLQVPSRYLTSMVMPSMGLCDTPMLFNSTI